MWKFDLSIPVHCPFTLKFNHVEKDSVCHFLMFKMVVGDGGGGGGGRFQRGHSSALHFHSNGR